MVEKGLIEGLANAGVPVLFAGLLLLGLVLLIRSSPGAAMARVRS
jgi:hypothetical protein